MLLRQQYGITEDEQFKALKAGKNLTLNDGTVIESYEIVGHPRPGDSFAYVTDTEYCPNAVKLAMNTNILYHEATFGNQLADKAKETGHSTAADAARVATEAQTKLLVIGHFSARYTNLHLLLKEAREGFYPTWLAQELRPIFTDPSHERGIVEPKVNLIDLTKKIHKAVVIIIAEVDLEVDDQVLVDMVEEDRDLRNFRPRKVDDGAASGTRGRYGSSNYENRGSLQKERWRFIQERSGGSRDYNNYDRNNRYNDSKPNKSITPELATMTSTDSR